jgi:hypothetical protein
MMGQTLEKRLAALEAAGGEEAIGVCYADSPDVVHVSGARLTPQEFAYDHPRGVLIRVRYGDGLPSAGEGDT